MTQCVDTHNCERSFDVLFEKIDKIDEAIRGNGKVGILVRLDRLEQARKRQERLIWLMLGGLVTCIATAIAMWIVR